MKRKHKRYTFCGFNRTMGAADGLLSTLIRKNFLMCLRSALMQFAL